MSKIKFEEVTYQNFRSVGNVPITIKLNSHKITLISGANGSGKTTVFSALCFGLFGKGFGNVTKPSLINSINQKKLLVTVVFSIGKTKYKVVRGMKPSIFEIYENDKLINQDPNIRDYQKVLEQQILKFNYRAFTQVVVIGGGSVYTPFMALSAKDRREFVEDLLDLRVFSTMNLLIFNEIKNTKDAIKDFLAEARNCKEKLILQESFINKLKAEKTAASTKIEEHISSLLAENEKITTLIAQVTEKYNRCAGKMDEQSEIDSLLSDLNIKIKEASSSIAKSKEKSNFYKELTQCPTCSQDVTNEYKQHILDQEEKGIKEKEKLLEELIKEQRSMMKRLKEYEVFVNEASELQAKLTKLNAERFANNKAINHANASLEASEKDTGNIEEESLKLKEFAKSFLEYTNKRKSALETLQYQEFIQLIISDSGIKSRIIKQYIPTINKLINHYLGVMDFFCGFNLDEHFNETITSRHRDIFTYDNFSEGQKRRIDLAILLTWMEIAKAKNALHCNILFLDEADAPFDQNGSDLLHEMLKTCSADNIFIVTHKADLLADKVDNVIKFEIKNNFTEIATY